MSRPEPLVDGRMRVVEGLLAGNTNDDSQPDIDNIPFPPITHHDNYILKVKAKQQTQNPTLGKKKDLIPMRG